MYAWITTLIKNMVFIAVYGALAGFLFAALPLRLFRYESFLFRTHAFEQEGHFYEKYFSIEKWKSKMPQFSEIMHFGFKKGELEKISHTYLQRFLIETMRAESCHIFLILTTPVYLLINTRGWGICMIAANCVCNLPFIMIQRYNRPRIAKLLAKTKQKHMKSSGQTG